MMETILEKLVSDYNFLINAKNSRSACIKYTFQYNKVTVNLYFDMFDSQLPSLNLVLIYLHNYYYSSLNVSKLIIPNQFLNQIPREILTQIIDFNETLLSFFEKVNNELLCQTPIRASYAKDYQFKDAVCKSNKENLPFLYCLRHKRMQDETLLLLQDTLAIPFIVLKAIQNHNMTIVRTDNIEYRKELTVILRENNISTE